MSSWAIHEHHNVPLTLATRFIRAEDHMANMGIYVGVTAKDPKFKDFLVLKDVVEVPAEKVWMSVDEIKALRAKNPQ